MKKIVSIDGGLGRILCSIPAIEELSKNNEVIVISSNAYEIFGNNPHVERIYQSDYVYLWEDVIKGNELLKPEPYQNYKYYTEKHHLIQSFNYILNNKEDFVKPNLYLTDSEDQFGIDFVYNLKKQTNKPLLIFQPFGRGSEVKQSTKEIFDPTNRSLSLKIVLHMINVLSKKYHVLLMSEFATPELVPYMPNNNLNIRNWFSIVKHCDHIIGVDSCLQHIGYIFDKPGAVLLGSTSVNNISYKDHYQIFARDGYPKYYDVYREVYQKPFWNNNDGSMDWSLEEINNIVNYPVINEDKNNGGKEICACDRQCC